MRLLHQVRSRERLLAQGIYVDEAGTREEWVWNEFPDGGQLLRVDTGSSLRELYYTEEGELSRVDWLRMTASSGTANRLRSTVSYFAEGAHLGQQRGDAEREYSEWALGADCLRVPPAQAAWGRFVKGIRDAGGNAPAISLKEGDAGLLGEVHRWSAEEISPSKWRLTREDAREWHLTLDEGNIPQRIQVNDTRDVWILQNYVIHTMKR